MRISSPGGDSSPLPTISGQKRPAQDQLPDGNDHTRPPSLRRSPFQEFLEPEASSTTIQASSVSDSQFNSLHYAGIDFPSATTRTAAHAQLQHAMSTMSCEDLRCLIMRTAEQSPLAGFYIDSQLRDMARTKELAKLADEGRKRKAEEERLQEMQRRKQTAHEFERLYTNAKRLVKDGPGSVTRLEICTSSSDNPEPNDMPDETDKASINDLFCEILNRCPANAPTFIQTKSFGTMVRIWRHVGPKSENYFISEECQTESCLWERPFLELWSRLGPEARTIVASTERFVKNMVAIAISWSNYYLREDMFNTVIQEMRFASGGKLASYYDSWDASYAPWTLVGPRVDTRRIVPSSSLTAVSPEVTDEESTIVDLTVV